MEKETQIPTPPASSDPDEIDLLALVTDRNKNFTSGLPRIELDRIQSRYSIAFSVFQELAKQLEQAKIQVKKDTPVFTIIEPVTVPSEKSKPNRPMILFIWLFLGGVIGTGIVFGKGFIEPLKKKWNATKNLNRPVRVIRLNSCNSYFYIFE